MKTIFTLLLFALVPVASLPARIDLLLVPPPAPVPGKPGVEFILYLNNPTDRDETAYLPVELLASYASSAGRGRVTLALVDTRDTRRTVPAMSRQTIRLRLKEPIPGAAGFVSLRLIDLPGNPIMFELDPAATLAPGASPFSDSGGKPMPRGPDVPPVNPQKTATEPLAASAPEPPPGPAPAARQAPTKPAGHIDLSNDVENMRRHISGYDPIYFAVGSRDRLNARFQFSFRYRVFEDGPPGEPWFQQLARDLYVAYTQTSIWDLESFSKPFYDSSYKPTAFLLHDFAWHRKRDWAFSLQAGAQHESNGKGASTALTPTRPGLVSPTTSLRHPFDTRSLNTLYFAPRVRWIAANRIFLEATVRASAYFQIDENPDIARYRGHAELTLRSGYDRGFQVSAHVRGKPSGHGSVEFNATWPASETPLLRLILPEALGGYAQIQYFNGYGESLLDYDVRRKDQLRLGLMIAR